MISLLIVMAVLILSIQLGLQPVWRISIGVIYFIYLTFFTAWGSYILPYFSSMEEWRYVDRSDTYHFGGTGVFINKSDVVTNDHVVHGCDKLAVRVGDKVYKGVVLSSIKPKTSLGRVVYSAYKDVAIIRTSARRKYFAVASQKIPKSGDVLYFPDYTSKPGKFSIKKAKAHKVDGDYLTITSFVTSRKGNSGSPIFNEKGYLVSFLHSGGSDHVLGISPKTHSTMIMSLREFFVKARSKVYAFDKEDVDFSKDEFFKRNVVGILCHRSS